MVKNVVPGVPANGSFQQKYANDPDFAKKLEDIAGSFSSGRTGGKEREPQPAKSEKSPEEMIEVKSRVEIEKQPELKGYVEEVESGVDDLTGGVTDDYTTRILLAKKDPKSDVLILPLTEEQVVRGLHEQVWDGLRWLAEWCVRQIKVLHGKVRYKDQ